MIDYLKRFNKNIEEVEFELSNNIIENIRQGESFNLNLIPDVNLMLTDFDYINLNIFVNNEFMINYSGSTGLTIIGNTISLTLDTTNYPTGLLTAVITPYKSGSYSKEYRIKVANVFRGLTSTLA